VTTAPFMSGEGQARSHLAGHLLGPPDVGALDLEPHASRFGERPHRQIVVEGGLRRALASSLTNPMSSRTSARSQPW